MSLWSHKSNTKTVGIDIASPMELPNGKFLQPGSYKLEVPVNDSSPEVIFYRNGKEVARDAAKVVSQPRKNPDTQLSSTQHGNSQVIDSISPAGWQSQLVLSR